MLAQHFPDHCVWLEEGIGVPEEVGYEAEDLKMWDAVHLDEYKVEAAMRSFGPKKVAGPDGLKPAVLQNLTKELYKRIAAV